MLLLRFLSYLALVSRQWAASIHEALAVKYHRWHRKPIVRHFGLVLTLLHHHVALVGLSLRNILQDVQYREFADILILLVDLQRVHKHVHLLFLNRGQSLELLIDALGLGHVGLTRLLYVVNTGRHRIRCELVELTWHRWLPRLLVLVNVR